MKHFILSLAALSCLVSCTSGDDEIIPSPAPDPDPVKIPINISMNGWTRVTDTDYESGDKVGIYVVNYQGSSAGTLQSSGNHVDNMCFTYTDNWTPESDIYWQDETTKADFYCYYPYGTPSDITAHPFSVKTDQSQQADYKASEFLWGKASGVSPTANAVPIITNRSMSNMLIYVAPGKGFTEETLAAATKSVRICNVKSSATVDLRTGVATATGSATEIIPYNEGTYYRALLVPQTVADGSNLITITVDGVDYTLAKGFTFKANTQHKFTVTVNKASSGVDIGVGNWEVDDTDNGGAAE